MNTVWASHENASRFYHCGALDLFRVLADDSIDCIWTDPPYLLSSGGITCVGGRMVSVDKGDWDRSQGFEKDHAFHRTWLRESLRVLKPTGTIWVTGTVHVYLSIGMAMRQEGFRILNDIIWEKPNPPPNLACRCFTHSTETVLWAAKASKNSKVRYTFNYHEMRREARGKQMKNVWRLGAPAADEKALGKHPTQKPVALVNRCLRASTQPGDIVLDPFAGSATTGVSSLWLSREFVGCEKDRRFVELAVKRLDDALRRTSQPTLILNA